MPRRTLSRNTFYHVYNRGWGKQSIFLSERDMEYFLLKSCLYRDEFPSIKVVAFAVLPNHFHFLIMDEDLDPGVTPTPGSSKNLSLFLGRLQNAYAKYFNQKYNRRGQLFEGRFCDKRVGDGMYFAQVKTYIEWNAVKHGMVNDPRDWSYSSYDPHTTPEGIFDESFDSGFL